MDSNDVMQWIVSHFLFRNYDYAWLRAMILRGGQMRGRNNTLITGSSHALSCIREQAWENAVNCSMHSQDIYYDFLCARQIIDKGGQFEKCFIILGYYIAYQDLSLSTNMREKMISPIYYPIFKDSHHWEAPTPYDHYALIGDFSKEVKTACEEYAALILYERNTYYSDIKMRVPFYDFGGRTWQELTEEERDAYGRQRTSSHNSLLNHQTSLLENREIMKDYVNYLYQKGILPIVVITPFSRAYNRYVSKEMKEAVWEMLDAVPQEVHFVDFNDSDLFDDNDFTDTDHLNALGAAKTSGYLTQMFGR